tara:strand:+ start:1247 stop:1819 length:573 start_codon:yes stop_codon:yes gene_type:complete
MKILKNPKTVNYYDLKDFILGESFPWYINQSVVSERTKSTRPVTNWAYTHCILGRPEYNHFYSSDSVKAELIIKVLSEIFNHNGIEKFFFLRVACNTTFPVPEKNSIGTFHQDHDYEHHNFILYLTPTDGGTFIEDSRYEPTVDSCITFQGVHANELPTYGRRVVIVATYITFETDESWKYKCEKFQMGV